MNEELIEKVEEIKSICIGVDSPDAILNGLTNPKDELVNCRKDIAKICDLIEEIETLLKEEKDV